MPQVAFARITDIDMPDEVAGPSSPYYTASVTEHGLASLGNRLGDDSALAERLPGPVSRRHGLRLVRLTPGMFLETPPEEEIIRKPR